MGVFYIIEPIFTQMCSAMADTTVVNVDTVDKAEEDEFTKSVVQSSQPKEDECCFYGCCGSLILTLSVFLCIILFPIAIPAGLKVIREYERAVIFRLGRARSTKASYLDYFALFRVRTLSERWINARLFS